MSKHTPGPWSLNAQANALGASVTSTVNKVRLTSHIPIADARLIAAAPEMLEALQQAQKSLAWANVALDIPEHSTFRENMAIVAAAIAKATGGDL